MDLQSIVLPLNYTALIKLKYIGRLRRPRPGYYHEVAGSQGGETKALEASRSGDRRSSDILCRCLLSRP